MRMSRVLLAGVAVAGAVATTSAFTASNTITGGDDTAGYGEVTVSGVAVSNVAYTPLSSNAAKLDNVIFTVAEDTTDMTGAPDRERVWAPPSPRAPSPVAPGRPP